MPLDCGKKSPGLYFTIQDIEHHGNISFEYQTKSSHEMRVCISKQRTIKVIMTAFVDKPQISR